LHDISRSLKGLGASAWISRVVLPAELDRDDGNGPNARLDSPGRRREIATVAVRAFGNRLLAAPRMGLAAGEPERRKNGW
jgi:hypothetical protein